MNNIMNAGHDGIKLWLVQIGPLCAHQEINTRELRSAPTGLQPRRYDHERAGSLTLIDTSKHIYKR